MLQSKSNLDIISEEVGQECNKGENIEVIGWVLNLSSKRDPGGGGIRRMDKHLIKLYFFKYTYFDVSIYLNPEILFTLKLFDNPCNTYCTTL